MTSALAAVGLPARTMPRSAMIDLQLTVVVGLAALFGVASGAVSKSPRRWFGMPHRDWWLAAEREEATRRDLAARVLWLGAFTQLLTLTLFHRTVRLNLGRADSLEGWYLDLAVFLAVAAVWLLLLQLRYRRPDSTAS
ncbi:MAG: hypothetical protein R3D98_10320 [Candidatus Krumholzibacteriia bacterium]